MKGKGETEGEIEAYVRKGEYIYLVGQVLFSTLLYIIVVQKNSEEKSPVGPYLLAFFIFVVCGSGKLFKNMCTYM